jgi:hypothetical protein
MDELAEEVTALIGIAPEKAGDRFVVVFFLCVVGQSELARTERKGEEMRTSSRADGFWVTVFRDDVPRCRVERYGRQGNDKGCFGHAEKGTERHDFIKSKSCLFTSTLAKQFREDMSHGSGGLVTANSSGEGAINNCKFSTDSNDTT